MMEVWRFLVVLLLCALSAVTRSENLLRDPDFRQGFEVMSPLRDIYTDRSRPEKVFRYDDGAANAAHKQAVPAWRLVQWGSARSLASAVPVLAPDGVKRWAVTENKNGEDLLYKSVAIYPGNAGDDHAALALELNGLAEFDAHYLAGTDHYWPHLLMVQNIRTRKLSLYRSLRFVMDARLPFDETNIREGYQKDLHAGRFVVSLAIHNTLSGNSFWLNLPVYDDRFAETGFGCQKCTDEKSCVTPQSLTDAGHWSCPFDGERWNNNAEKKGTRRMIFRLPTRAITGGDIRQHAWTHYEVDLLPYITAGMEAAQNEEKLHGFLPSLKYFDVTLLSLGWEMTGLNHASMEIRDLALQADK
jgi:hypothetical protein